VSAAELALRVVVCVVLLGLLAFGVVLVVTGWQLAVEALRYHRHYGPAMNAFEAGVRAGAMRVEAPPSSTWRPLSQAGAPRAHPPAASGGGYPDRREGRAVGTSFGEGAPW